MCRVSISACAINRCGEGCGSQGAVWCSPIQASVKPSSSAQRKVCKSQRWPSKRPRSGGCEGIVKRPYCIVTLPAVGWRRSYLRRRTARSHLFGGERAGTLKDVSVCKHNSALVAFFLPQGGFSLRQFDAAAVSAVSGLTKTRLEIGGHSWPR